MVCKRCGSDINRARGWRCPVRPELTCVGWTGNYIFNYFSGAKK